jgi:hypothetical protein
MKRNLLTSIFLPLLLIVTVGMCAFYVYLRFLRQRPVPALSKSGITGPSLPSHIGAIPVPPGFERLPAAKGSFAEWLQNIRIKKDKTVFLYNGVPKRNQEAHYVVLDVPVGNKDLQQCADAVMRLRAQYLYSQKRFAEISFSDNSGKKYKCPASVDSTRFERYLENVYAYCGTLSLEKQLHKVADLKNIQPGDVLIKGGSPGHAVIVTDVAVSKTGRKLYMLAQSYMPAQNIHVLKNPSDSENSPWYEVNTNNSFIFTPEWLFTPNQLKRW